MALASPKVELEVSRRARSMGAAVEEKVYVAVGKEIEESKGTLLWALHNTSREQRIVLVHVHRLAQMIPMRGTKIHARLLKKQDVNAYRQVEQEKMHKTLDEYLIMCSQRKVRAEQVVIQMNDVAKGIVELIGRFGITKLVMGAAMDKYYSEKMIMPKSKTAISVKRRADPSCKIWFICQGHLICTSQEACFDASGLGQSSMASPCSLSTQSEQLRLRHLSQGLGESSSWSPNPIQDLLRHKSRSDNFDSHEGGTMEAQPPAVSVKTSLPQGIFNTEGNSVDPWEARITYQSLDNSLWSLNEDVLSDSGSLSIPKDEKTEAESLILPLMQESDEDLQFSTPDNELEVGVADPELYHKLQEALKEAENLKREAYQESCRRQKAERDLVNDTQKARAAENLYAKEMTRRKEIESKLASERLEIEMLKNQQDEVLEQLQKTTEKRLELELHIVDSDNIINDLEEKISEAQSLLNSLQAEHEELQRERNDAIRDAEELRHKKQMIASSYGAINSSKFSNLELEQATQSFSNSLKIGEGSFGSVYKGFLRKTTVVIKVLNSDNQQGRLEFHQEVDVLTRVRHPNLVTLIGACSEARALVYEFLPRGNLEDRLACKNNTPALTWQVRTRIAAEICSTLMFLHSHRPHPLVHGDLKPDNILLDANLVSKLDDFGICRLLTQSNNATLFSTHTKDTFVYTDPEFLTTGELTPHSDVYSFGVILLRLLTGRPAFGIVKEVQEAMDKEYLVSLLDASAGDWPFVQTKQLAHLGLRCCKMKRKNRPDLAREVFPVLKCMQKSTLPMSSLSFESISDDNRRIPNYFICPILQEIMRDPHIAADGFTYEADALKGWFDNGHDTSPMTNLRLPHCDLLPNRALRTAIQEWMQQLQS